MKRTELINAVRSIPALVEKINKVEGCNFTNVKSSILEAHLENWKKEHSRTSSAKEEKKVEKTSEKNIFESALIALLVALDSKGVLKNLLDKIK